MHGKITFSTFTGSFALALLSCAAAAQAFDPGQVERRFNTTTEPKFTPSPVETQQTAPEEAVAPTGPTFTLNGVVIEGSHVYDDATFKSFYEDLIGKKISYSDLRSITASITRKLRTDGYVLSQATLPPQDINKGIVKILIVEGSIVNVSIDGDVNDKRGLVQEYAERIKAEKPLKISTLERYLLLIDDLPGVTARGLVRPIPGQPGMNDLLISLSQKKYEGSLSTDNRGTEQLGPYQYTATASANSLFGLYERTMLRGIVTSPISELQFFDLQHEEQLGDNGTRFLVVGSHTRTEPGDALAPLDVRGTATSAQASLIHPFIRSRKENFSTRVTFDYRDTRTDILGSKNSEDKMRVLRAGASFDYADKFDGVTLIDGEVSQGIDGLGANDEGAGRSRIDGDNSFTKINMTISRLQNLPHNFSVFASAGGQYAFDPLFAPEEFLLGGLGFGQAYDPSELSGDHGAAAKLELRYSAMPGFRYLNAFQLYTYYDIGSVWNKDPLPGDFDKESLASAGIGVRANLTDWLSGNVELAMPLTRDVAIEGNTDTRGFFSLTARF